ncbi:MAG: hypothetical protein HN849_06675 [Victivallales bacterium]|jgi:hypothetical protein|nr:hypothetical protein [Victivallales bacterium]
MNFLDQLFTWLQASFANQDTSEIRGYSFNLVENGGEFSVELIGSPEFDDEGPDWACDEVFVGTPRSIPIPQPIHEGHWEKCLENMVRVLSDYLECGDVNAQILKRAEGTSTGFVDGELVTIFRRNKPDATDG